MEKITKRLLFQIVLLMCYYSHSQIVYTDVNPDVITTMSEAQGSANFIYAIDLDNNGAPEYNFRWDDWGQFWFMHLMYNPQTTEIGLKGTATNQFGGRFVLPLQLNASIDNTLIWGFSTPEPFIGESTLDANFLNLGDRYIPVRFKINGNSFYYGWILVNFESVGISRRLTIKSFAYNSTINQPILAGQTSLLNLDNQNLNLSLKIGPNPVQNTLIIENQDKQNQINQILIYNQLGEIVYKETSNFTNLNISALQASVYHLSITTNDGKIFHKKIIKI